MVAIQRIREELAGIQRLGPGLVGIFVGGTSGIGESTAREFVRHAVDPRLYVIGRNKTQAAALESQFRSLNPTCDMKFILCDVSELRSVDKVCEQIKQKESKVNLLFLSAGIFHFRGREETSEGLDRKMALDFYTRLRFTENLLPQLRRAASPSGVDTSNNPSPVSHVVTVLGGGNEQPVNVDDLSLKNNYTLNTATQHAVTMNTLAFDHLASKPENAGISFVHTSPGMVKTQGVRELGTLFYIGVSIFAFLFKPLTVPVGECGERHLWAGTNKSLQGGAVHLINKNSEIIRNLKVLKDMKDRGVAEKVWEHTRTVFTKVCTEGGKYEA